MIRNLLKLWAFIKRDFLSEVSYRHARTGRLRRKRARTARLVVDPARDPCLYLDGELLPEGAGGITLRGRVKIPDVCWAVCDFQNGDYIVKRRE